jgi:putative hydrolase of the HAD superfamily
VSPRAVLFDLDDTLYGYAPCNEAALAVVAELARGAGGPDASGFRALHDEVRRELAVRHAGTAASHDRARFFAEMVSRLQLPAQLASEWYECYWTAFLAAMQPAPGARAVLDELRARCPLALVSNHTTAPQLAKLTRLELADCFSAVVTSEEAGAEKPAARPFELALERLGLGAQDVVMVGDDPVGDIGGAQALGLRALQSLQFKQHAVRAEGADGVFRDLRELIALLEF